MCVYVCEGVCTCELKRERVCMCALNCFWCSNVLLFKGQNDPQADLNTLEVDSQHGNKKKPSITFTNDGVSSKKVKT